jgi:hypothetical protein
MKTNYLFFLIVLITWICFYKQNSRKDFTEFNILPVEDFSGRPDAMNDSEAYPTVHTPVRLDVSNGYIDGCINLLGCQTTPGQGISPEYSAFVYMDQHYMTKIDPLRAGTDQVILIFNNISFLI